MNQNIDNEEQVKICQNPECKKLITKKEYEEHNYGSEWNWQRLKYCSQYCRGRARYFKLKKEKEEKYGKT